MHGVHGPVADVRQNVQAPEVSQALHNSGKALREDLHIVDAHQVILPMIPKLDQLIPHEVLAEGLLLGCDPLDGQTDCQHGLTLRDVPELQLFGQCRHGEDVVVLILALVADKALVIFTDHIILALIIERVRRHGRLGVIGFDARAKDHVPALDIAEAMVDPDDFFSVVVVMFH